MAIVPADLELTAEQERAVRSDAKAIVVVASAGSGKTETVARRVLRLLEDSEDLGRVLALSYTNKAAEELSDRLGHRMGSLAERVTTETVHGFAHSLLRQHGTRIGLPLEPEILRRDEDRVELLAAWRESEGLPALDDPLAILRQVDLDRAKLVSSAEVDDWRNALASLPGLDFAALLDAATELLELNSVRRQLQRTYRHVIVDEAQNLTPSQYRLIDSVIGDGEGGPTVMLVGDDKQSIVQFAGADPTLINRFSRERNASVIHLTANFRSARLLNEMANRVAEGLAQKSKPVVKHAASGKIVLLASRDEEEEGRQVASWVNRLLEAGIPEAALAPGESSVIRPEEVAVLSRSASALARTVNALGALGVPLSVASGASDWLEGVAGQLVLEIISLRAAPAHVSTQWQLGRLLKVDKRRLANEADVELAIRNHPDPSIASVHRLLAMSSLEMFMETLRDIEQATSQDASELASWRSDVDELERAWDEFKNSTDRDARTWANFRMFCSRRQRGSSTEGVQLLTIHKAQGREFKAVAVIGLNDGQLPDFRAKDADAWNSELRAFYVAVTRARRILLLSRALSRATRYGPRASTPSPFLRFADGLV